MKSITKTLLLFILALITFSPFYALTIMNFDLIKLETTNIYSLNVVSDSQSMSETVIGKWNYKSKFQDGEHTLLSRNGKIFFVSKYKDGSSSDKEVSKTKSNGLTRFEVVGGNSFGEYYLIEADGRLGVYDNDGLIHKMRLVK